MSIASTSSTIPQRRPEKPERRPPGHSRFYPSLFALIACCAFAELGLTAFLVNAGNARNTWPTQRYHHLLILFVFNSAWTLLFSATYILWIFDGATHVLANIASSIIWLLLTSVLWGTAAGVMHVTRTGGYCPGYAPISRCRQSLTVEAIGWTEFALCTITLISTCIWVHGSNRSYRTSVYEV